MAIGFFAVLADGVIGGIVRLINAEITIVKATPGSSNLVTFMMLSDYQFRSRWRDNIITHLGAIGGQFTAFLSGFEQGP